jgi:Protein of unknown function (DUF2934)
MPSTQTTKSSSSKKAAVIAPAPATEVKEPVTPETTISDEEKRAVLIRLAAYSFYERRGYIEGHELEDWLQAEMEVDRQLAAAPKPKKAK